MGLAASIEVPDFTSHHYSPFSSQLNKNSPIPLTTVSNRISSFGLQDIRELNDSSELTEGIGNRADKARGKRQLGQEISSNDVKE